MQEAKMVVQTGPRLKRGFERRIERGKFCCAAAAYSLGLAAGGSAAASGGGAASSGAGLTMSVSGLKCGASGSASKDVTPCADDIAMMPGNASAEGAARDASSGRAGVPARQNTSVSTETPKNSASRHGARIVLPLEFTV
jgi:hypothetical protein